MKKYVMAILLLCFSSGSFASVEAETDARCDKYVQTGQVIGTVTGATIGVIGSIAYIAAMPVAGPATIPAGVVFGSKMMVTTVTLFGAVSTGTAGWLIGTFGGALTCDLKSE